MCEDVFFLFKPFLSKIEKVPWDIQGEKSRKRYGKFVKTGPNNMHM